MTKESTPEILRQIIDELYRSGKPDLPERRAMSDDHDLLLRIDEKLTGMGNAIISANKELNEHKKEDVVAFKEISDRQSKSDLKMAFYAGAICVVVFLMKLFLNV